MESELSAITVIGASPHEWAPVQKETYPRITSISLRNLNPHLDAAILQVLVLPEQRTMDARVRMPAGILASGERMHVEHGVQSLGSASFNDSIHELEALLLDDEVLLVVHEVAMIDRYAYAVQSEGSKEFCIVAGEKVIEELDALVADQSSNLMRRHTLSKKWSYFSCPSTSSIAARISCSWPGYPVMKFSMLPWSISHAHLAGGAMAQNHNHVDQHHC